MSSLAPAAPAVKQDAIVFVAATTATEQYWDGFYSFMDNIHYSEMTTDDQKRGWMAALSAELEANMPGYAESQGF